MPPIVVGVAIVGVQVLDLDGLGVIVCLLDRQALGAVGEHLRRVKGNRPGRRSLVSGGVSLLAGAVSVATGGRLVRH
jgi:hypothetical protein